MKPINGGYYCDFCKKEVLDLTHLTENDLLRWRSENSKSCVVINESKSSPNKFPLSHFALALLLVGGSAMFKFANAQLKDSIENVKVEISAPIEPSLGILTVHLKNQVDKPTWGNVWVQLPNGKELELYEGEKGTYFVEIPAYCKGKELVVYAEHLKKKKHLTTTMFQLSEELEVTFVFKSSKNYVRRVRGSF